MCLPLLPLLERFECDLDALVNAEGKQSLLIRGHNDQIHDGLHRCVSHVMLEPAVHFDLPFRCLILRLSVAVTLRRLVKRLLKPILLPLHHADGIQLLGDIHHHVL